MAEAVWDRPEVIRLIMDSQSYWVLGLCCADVRFWHLADIQAASENVRFSHKADICNAHPNVCF